MMTFVLLTTFDVENRRETSYGHLADRCMALESDGECIFCGHTGATHSQEISEDENVSQTLICLLLNRITACPKVSNRPLSDQQYVRLIPVF